MMGKCGSTWPRLRRLRRGIVAALTWPRKEKCLNVRTFSDQVASHAQVRIIFLNGQTHELIIILSICSIMNSIFNNIIITQGNFPDDIIRIR